jgi:hypothetical protein
MKNIFVVIDGEQRGPLGSGELRDLLEAGEIQPDTPALCEGDQEWSTVAKLSRLPEEEGAARKVVGAGVQPMASLPRDLKNLRGNSSATVDELRDFMRQMRGKSPADMLGAIAQSTLVRSLIVSTVSIVALLFTLTAASYFFTDEQDSKVPEKSVDQKVADSEEKEGSPKSPEKTVSVPVVNPPEVLGVGGEKTGKPKEVNPFENDNDPLNGLKID